ncbi:MAG TPA: hypothetical protein VGA33_01435 [Thermoanaerobaculia bacterium]
MDEMAAVAREEMQLQAGLVVADPAQRVFVDLMLRAEVVSKELEGGSRSGISPGQ